MNQPSAEQIARTIVDTLVDRGDLLFDWDHREDQDGYIEAGRRVLDLFNTSELELRLRELEKAHAQRPIALAAIQYIRSEAAGGIDTVGEARGILRERYMQAPSESFEELEAWAAYRLLGNKY